MKATQEPIYVNEDFYGGTTIDGGVSTIAHIPTSTPIIVGQNPNLVTNEYGQTMVNPDIPVPINQPTSTPTNFISDAVVSVKEIIAEITNTSTTSTTTGATTGGTSGTTTGGATGGTSGTTTPPKANATTNSNAQALIKDLKQIQSTKDAKIKPKTNYLLYGLIGVGALVVFMGVFKKK